MTYERYEFLMAVVRNNVPATTMNERIVAATELINDRPARQNAITKWLQCDIYPVAREG